jgi:hippurate hydrolase
MKAEAKDCFLGCVMLFLLGISTAIAAERGDSSGQSALHARVDGWVERELPDLLKVYRHLHANPELSLEESKTSALVAKALGKAGYSVETGIGGYGVIGILRNGPGPTLLIRGDMDGLPVVEATGLRYASVVRTTNAEGVEVGVMHACGHDVHITNLLGTARLLAEMVNAWRGTLVILAQPAEELGLGALHMIDDGLFDRIPRPDHAIALHVAADLPAGSIGFVSGWAAANVDWVKITMVGRGGHGARPHEAIDPIVMSAHLVTALQSIVSRQIDPSDPAVVTVGSIHGGSKSNVIPDRVKLELTVRSYSDEV